MASASTDASAPVVSTLRLTGRGRVLVWSVAAALASGVGLAAQSAAADGPDRATPVVRHVVAPGDTLWGIAAAVVQPGEDVRDVVEELSDLNGLDGAGLVAGAEVLVPAERP